MPTNLSANLTLSPDLFEQLNKPEIQESLAVIICNLPKLAEMSTLLTRTFDVIQNLAKDHVFINDTVSGIEEFIKPIQNKVKETASIAIEAQDRAKIDEQTINLLGMLKMLKDPQVQSMLRFTQAFLTVTGERQRTQK